MTKDDLATIVPSHTRTANNHPCSIVLSILTGVKCTDYSKNKNAELRNQHTEIMEVISKKVDEESQPHAVGKIPDRYDAEDDSYLNRVPKLNQR